MKTRLVVALFLLGALGNAGSLLAEGGRAEAIKQERAKYKGAWRIVFLQADGKQAADNDVRKIMVVNGDDGTWSIQVDGKEINRGTSEIDPTKKPKTIEFTPADGPDKGKRLLGIYDIKENCRKLCFAPAGKPRPAEFASRPQSGHILVIFQREPSQKESQ